MKEMDIRQDDDIEIDLGRVFHAIANRLWIAILVAVLTAAAVFGATYFLVTPQYTASAMFYVNNSSLSLGETSLSISSGSLSASRSLVDSYIVILNTKETLTDVIDYAGVKRSVGSLSGMISAEAVNETEFFRVSVTSSDPNEAERIANAIGYVLPKRIGVIIDGTSARVAEAASVPRSPVSPNYTKNTILGFILGFALTVVVVTLMEVLDITIRTEDDLSQVCRHPILARVPDMDAPSKGDSAYYGYGASRSGKNKKKAVSTPTTKQSVIGPNISFAASEAYKLLRTKLQFSFAKENNCRVIGLSSALSGEGKSLTAVNLSFVLSQLNKRVLLIDCDMRRPTLAEKLNIQKMPGLSNYLTVQSGLEELIQNCGIKGNEDAFHVITAGQNPPNPIELLSSERMTKALEILRKVYDYVILDLPPVCEVSDAMAVANETDGMLVVVRQNYCDRIALAEFVRQFDFIDAKVLGVVFNCANEHGTGYGKGYYKRYYKTYHKQYGRVYENTGRTVSGK